MDRCRCSPMTRSAPSTPLFSRPVDVAASGPTPQTFQVYARGLDPDRTDVVAQLVAGPADGRVVAKTSSLSTAGRLGFSGTAIPDKDLLLVGFSAGSSAFGFLNGQKWGLMHTPGGVVAEPPAVMANSPGGPSGPNSSPAVLCRPPPPRPPICRTGLRKRAAWTPSCCAPTRPWVSLTELADGRPQGLGLGLAATGSSAPARTRPPFRTHFLPACSPGRRRPAAARSERRRLASARSQAAAGRPRRARSRWAPPPSWRGLMGWGGSR